MDAALRAAASGMNAQQTRTEVIANNLANVSTDGFKKERVFARMIGDALPAVDAVTDRTAGTLRPTGAPLDLALGGDGFFVVSTPQGERLSRGGSFRLDEGGRLVDANGNALLSTNGPLVLPHGDEVSITEDGVVRAGGAEVARLRLESVPAAARIQHAGGNLFIPDDAARAPPPPA